MIHRAHHPCAPGDGRPFVFTTQDSRVHQQRAIGWACAVLIVCGTILAAPARGVENRTFDGTLNHPSDLGAVNSRLLRHARVAYGDGVRFPAGANRPSARVVSNDVSAQTVTILNSQGLSSYAFQWAQFLTHDISLTPGDVINTPMPIIVPPGDPQFDPFNNGMETIEFWRSKFDPATSTSIGNPRQQFNEVTSFIDASMVYGSDATRAAALRTGVGGLMKTSGDNMLPLNTDGLPNERGPNPNPDSLYVAGDVRVNAAVTLTALQTVMLREHNRLAGQIATANPLFSDEEIYQRARKVVGAQIQVVTYNEYLPAVIGPHAPGLESTYDSTINPSIANEFTAALFRMGHTVIPTTLMRVAADGSTAPGGHLPLRQASFQTQSLPDSTEMEYLLRGLAVNPILDVDLLVIDDIRNLLFGPTGAGGVDLVAVDIQRGRDHGLPDYNSVRDAYGLPKVGSFAEVTSDVALAAALAVLYNNDVDDIDVWVGAMAEDHLSGSSMGELVTVALEEQFTRLRDGDRFWYRNDPDFSPGQIAQLEATTLADIIMRNTTITNLQSNVFFVPEPTTLLGLALGGSLLALARWKRRR